MGWLKGLVIVMGIAIIVGVTVVVVTIIQRAGTLAPAAQTATIDLPAGARILGQDLAEDRILLRLGLADGSEQLLVIDAASGAVVGRHTLRMTDGGK